MDDDVKQVLYVQTHGREARLRFFSRLLLPRWTMRLRFILQ